VNYEVKFQHLFHILLKIKYLFRVIPAIRKKSFCTMKKYVNLQSMIITSFESIIECKDIIGMNATRL